MCIETRTANQKLTGRIHMDTKTQYKLKEKSIPLDDTYEVIVAGGGPAGCAAAIAAAREGARTLLIESTGCLGGMGTAGLVPSWAPFWDKEKVVYGGIAHKVLEECKKGLPHVGKEELHWVPIDAEYLKRVYDDMVTGSGAKILFNTVLSCVETDGGGTVTGVIVTNKSGLTAYRAKVYVDCTGDADLAAWAGAEYIKGDTETGELQPATMCFLLSNVDDYAYQYGQRLHASNENSPIYKILDSGEYPLIKDKHCCNQQVGPGLISFNAGHLWDVDNTDPFSVTEALITGRKIAAQFREALAKYQPKAFGNALLASTGTLMGIRETRRVLGDYILTETDYMNRASFEDEIGRNSYYLDIHHSEHEVILEKMGKIDWEKRCARYEKGESHGIPYRCLTPKGLNNVLVAGRSISCDRSIQGSVRVMPACLVMGEAAGIAAVYAMKQPGSNVHNIDTSVLRNRLREEGAYLP